MQSKLHVDYGFVKDIIQEGVADLLAKMERADLDELDVIALRMAKLERFRRTLEKHRESGNEVFNLHLEL